ncbi:MAG: 30S ribosomal protein S5 [Rickettsiales bacterium]|nr:30S ribosomal protein S5 [Pseudomonadota bacterium]MDA0967251.1 30S ribosomal protein S5 [Pseudomonadota bacterium]MDG4544088.1 30S ribosomal protein S5 [Rickettsiales bacterium]MDG4546218.1 30S ribosomal protein S5 [Rickettsiales bacterium]MDG4548412.1 30S ribosomal protein S5 [Rickettsiales bacterium]
MAAANKRDKRDNQSETDNASSDIVESLVSIRRVSKVTKGGRTFGFSALVIVGDEKGRVGYGSGSGLEVMDAKRKATESAKKKLIRVPLREGRTLHHDVVGRFGAGKVNLRTAPAGTGIIAGGPLRAVFECLGVHDVVAKSIGTSNPHNMVKACFDAFTRISSPRSVADRRSKKVGDIVGRREGVAGKSEEDNKDEGK